MQRVVKDLIKAGASGIFLEVIKTREKGIRLFYGIDALLKYK